MPTSQNFQVELFKDYIPAELKENKTWEIVYYIINPNTNKLARKRNRVRPIKQITLSRKFGLTPLLNLSRCCKASKIANIFNYFLSKEAYFCVVYNLGYLKNSCFKSISHSLYMLTSFHLVSLWNV